MANVLTAAEAANFIRSTVDDAVMLQYLPLVDEYLKNASGHDWAADSTKHPAAKMAAGMLLTYWYDNPTAIGHAPDGLTALMVQLEAEALKYRKYVFAGLHRAGTILLEGARKGDTVISITGVYGVSGSQLSAFASVLAEDHILEQTSANDLSDNLYVAVLKSPADDVSA